MLVQFDYGNGSLIWNGLSGFVEPGEDPKQAVVREVKEEIGIDLEISSLSHKGNRVVSDELDLELFTANKWTGTPEPKEVSIKDIRWFEASDLPFDQMFPGNETWVPSLLKNIQKSKIQRIAIIGISGSGKSVCSRKIAELTRLPLYHMDNLFWRGNWQAVPEKEYLAEHELLIKKDRWIIEGYVDESMQSRLSRADLVIYLDYSGIRAAWHVLLRWVLHRKESRPELPAEALEKFPRRLLRVALTRGERPGIEKALASAGGVKTIRLFSPKQLTQFLS